MDLPYVAMFDVCCHADGVSRYTWFYPHELSVLR